MLNVKAASGALLLFLPPRTRLLH